MSTLAEIREEIAANLSVIPDVQVSAWTLANPSPPTIEVMLGWRYSGSETVTYDRAFQRGMDSLSFTIRAYVALATDIGGQKLLMRFCDPNGTESVKQAAESDRTLDGLVRDLRVTEMRGEFQIPREGKPPMLGVEFHAEVWMEG